MNPLAGLSKRMCAPLSVGAIEPVGMTKGSTTYDRPTNARAKAMMMEINVSLRDSGSGLAGAVWVVTGGGYRGMRRRAGRVNAECAEIGGGGKEEKMESGEGNGKRNPEKRRKAEKAIKKKGK